LLKDKNHSLKLYEHLLNKTTLTHDKAIKKHIENKQTCKILANLVQNVIFCPRGGDLPIFAEVE
jgi:hypothetical protein